MLCLKKQYTFFVFDMKNYFAYKKKIILPEHAGSIAKQLRAVGKSVVLVAGTFNPFRDHHRHLYRQAAEHGVVFASTNSDKSLRLYRSAQNRNDFLFPLWYRLKCIAECPHITYVTWYNDTNVAETIRNIKPDVFFMGPDYSEETIHPLERVVTDKLGIINMFARDCGKKPFLKGDLNWHIAELERAVRKGHKFNPYVLKVPDHSAKVSG